MYEPIHQQIARIRTEELISRAAIDRAARRAAREMNDAAVRRVVREMNDAAERAPRKPGLGRIAAGVLHLRPRVH
jgi:histone H3/H4